MLTFECLEWLLKFYLFSMVVGMVCNTLKLLSDYRLILQINSSLFSVFCPHTHVISETSQKITHLNTTSSQTRLTMKFLFVMFPKRRYILFV